MNLLKYAYLNFIYRKRQSLLLMLLVFVVAVTLTLTQVMMGVFHLYRQRNENPYSDYYRLLVSYEHQRRDEDVPFHYAVGYESLDDMKVSLGYDAAKLALRYFRNITNYTMELTCINISTPMQMFVPVQANEDWRDNLTVIASRTSMELDEFFRGELSLTSGELITDKHGNQPVCIISDTMAEMNGLQVGDKFTVTERTDVIHQYNDNNEIIGFESIYENVDLTVIGIFHDHVIRSNSSSSAYDYVHNWAYVPLEFMESIAEHDSTKVVNFQIKLDSDAHIERITEEFNELQLTSQSGGTFVKVSEIYAAENQGVQSIMAVLSLVQKLFFVAALVLELLFVFSVANSRKREIGVHLALGSPKGRVSFMMGLEMFLSACIGFLGAVALSLYIAEPVAMGLLESAAAGMSAEAIRNTTLDSYLAAAEQTKILGEAINDTFVIECILEAAVWILAIFTVGVLFSTVRISSMRPMVLFTKREENA